ncbi:Hint domain-containing protein [Roseovarius ramblicola]|uniref:Hint domain-containing protein n=1 Tax=Roseovarius ramblicola TaxID=2022336 RepID=A0ABV5HYV1_9RHOB
MQPLCWLGSVTLSGADLRRRPEFRPVRIRAHAFGPGRPARDLLVSPQHRVLLRDWRAELYHGEAKVLAAVVHLVDGGRVLRATAADGIRYLHIMCDSHQIIRAEGLETETFLPTQGARGRAARGGERVARPLPGAGRAGCRTDCRAPDPARMGGARNAPVARSGLSPAPLRRARHTPSTRC